MSGVGVMRSYWGVEVTHPRRGMEEEGWMCLGYWWHVLTGVSMITHPWVEIETCHR